MLFTVKMYEFTTEGEGKKEAWIKAIREVNELMNCKKEKAIFSFEVKKNERNKNLLHFIVYMSLDIDEKEEVFCEACKEFHHAFYINQDYNCSACKHKAFIEQTQASLKSIAAYYKSKINFKKDENNS